MWCRLTSWVGGTWEICLSILSYILDSSNANNLLGILMYARFNLFIHLCYFAIPRWEVSCCSLSCTAWNSFSHFYISLLEFTKLKLYSLTFCPNHKGWKIEGSDYKKSPQVCGASLKSPETSVLRLWFGTLKDFILVFSHSWQILNLWANIVKTDLKGYLYSALLKSVILAWCAEAVEN